MENKQKVWCCIVTLIREREFLLVKDESELFWADAWLAAREFDGTNMADQMLQSHVVSRRIEKCPFSNLKMELKSKDPNESREDLMIEAHKKAMTFIHLWQLISHAHKDAETNPEMMAWSEEKYGNYTYEMKCEQVEVDANEG